eukprot:1230114-Prorocentrum_lima.AAC.1
MGGSSISGPWKRSPPIGGNVVLGGLSFVPRERIGGAKGIGQYLSPALDKGDNPLRPSLNSNRRWW